jgi:hypothetical protein
MHDEETSGVETTEGGVGRRQSGELMELEVPLVGMPLAHVHKIQRCARAVAAETAVAGMINDRCPVEDLETLKLTDC